MVWGKEAGRGTYGDDAAGEVSGVGVEGLPAALERRFWREEVGLGPLRRRLLGLEHILLRC